MDQSVFFIRLRYFFVVILPAFRRYEERSDLRRKYLKDANGFLGEHELDITDSGLRLRFDNIEMKVAWSVIERVEITPEYAFLYISPTSAHVVPLSRITNGDVDAFVAELKGNLIRRVR